MVKLIPKHLKGSYLSFLRSLPQNLQNTLHYNMYKNWRLNGMPNNFLEGIDRDMFTKYPDGWHSRSIAWNDNTEEYEGLKSLSHDTVDMELNGSINWQNEKGFIPVTENGETFKYIPKNKFKLNQSVILPILTVMPKKNGFRKEENKNGPIFIE